MAILMLLLLWALPVDAQFSHAQHIDPKARIDPKTGFRADCTFCHRFDQAGVLATMPSQQQCDACHAKPGFTPQRLSPPAAATQYPGIVFSHASHFRQKLAWKIGCTTCHSTDGSLPKMIDCVACHDQSRRMPAAAQMSNCRTCHADSREGRYHLTTRAMSNRHSTPKPSARITRAKPRPGTRSVSRVTRT